jgi:hypothetical protein
VSGNVVGDNGQQVVGVGLFKVPEDGEVAHGAVQRLFARLVPCDVVASLLQKEQSVNETSLRPH